MSGISKTTAERHQRMLLELLQKPGNDVCADCKGRMPRWSSWNLGIFLCVQCASVHRKIGTHITKVKSISLDSWTREQVDSVKNMGNVKSNAYYNPDERRNPPPTNMEDSERDSELEKYIRSKYEYKKFVVKETSRSKPAKDGMLPPPPPPNRAKSTPLPSIIASKPSPPLPPAELEREPVFGSTLQYRPSMSRVPPSASRTASTAGLPNAQAMQQPFTPSALPSSSPGPSALSSTSPVWNDMIALETGSPLPASQPSLQINTQPMANPFHALQQRQHQLTTGGPSLPSSFLGSPHSPMRSVSLPVGAASPSTLSPSIISPPLSYQSTGLNPFFVQQQAQGGYLQPSPTGYQSPPAVQHGVSGYMSPGLTHGMSGPINIPVAANHTAHLQPSPSGSSYFRSSSSPSSSGYLQPSSSPSPYLSMPGMSPYQSAFQQPSPYPMQQQQQPVFTPNSFPSQPLYPFPVSPVSQQTPAEQHLSSFVTGMLPPQQRQQGAGTNPFGTAWQGQYGQPGSWSGT